MLKILVAEDDKNIRYLYEQTLREEGFQVVSAVNGTQALDLFQSQVFDLAIIDVMMPEMDGLTLIKIVRESGIEIPMIIISALGEPFNVKQGFVAGSDDYMVKPIDIEELLLRIRALLKRSKIAAERKIAVGDLVFDYDSFVVKDSSRNEIHLPKKEFLLIYKLLSYPNKIFTRFQLLNELWGLEADSDESTINVHINRLRNKFKDRKEFTIVTVKGLGYKVII